MKKALGMMLAIMVVAILIGTFVTVKYATAGEKARDGRFIAYDNGTVLDTKTKLMWAAKDNGKDINWANAKSYCENYRGGGYRDWRMPDMSELYELKGLYGDGSIDGNNNYRLATMITLTNCCLWASTIENGNTGNAAAIPFHGRVIY